MNTFLKTFYTPIYMHPLLPSLTHIKPLAKLTNLAKGFFSFLLIASFLASCSTSLSDNNNGDSVDIPIPMDTNDLVDTTDPIITCPLESVALTIPINATSIDPATIEGISAVDDSGVAPTLTYVPASISVETAFVIASAMDEASNFATCMFLVEVTQDVVSETLTDIVLDCSGVTTPIVMLDANKNDIVLASVIDGLTVTDGDNMVLSPVFIYTPDTISEVGTQDVTVRVEDADGHIAITSSGSQAECTVTVTVIPTPMLNCPDDSSGVEDAPITWDSPTIIDGPAGATVVPSVMSGDADAVTFSETGGTFTEVGDYTIIFTAMDGTSTITVGEGVALVCTFVVTVEVPRPPMGSVFFLLDNDKAPSDTNPFLIPNAFYLSELARVVNANEKYSNINDQQGDPVQYATAAYRLTDNITLSLSDENNFAPIGRGVEAAGGAIECEDLCFTGTFDGDNHTISGLHFSNVNFSNVGLFGVLSGTSASISNLIVVNANIVGNSNVGGLVGLMINSSSISNVASIGGTINGGVSIEDSTAIGGLVGGMGSRSKIINAYASVDVGTDGTGTYIGGLVGLMSFSSITNVFASGAVNGRDSLGGLVGNSFSDALIINAYASGSVGNASSTGRIGGLVGALDFGASIENALAWGRVRGSVSSSVGGFVGQALPLSTFSPSPSPAELPMVSASYWDTDATKQNTSAGTGEPQNANYSGHDTDILQQPTIPGTQTGNLYFGWESDVWDFGTGMEYPRLKGLPITVACQRMPMGEDCPG